MKQDNVIFLTIAGFYLVFVVLVCSILYCFLAGMICTPKEDKDEGQASLGPDGQPILGPDGKFLKEGQVVGESVPVADKEEVEPFPVAERVETYEGGGPVADKEERAREQVGEDAQEREVEGFPEDKPLGDMPESLAETRVSDVEGDTEANGVEFELEYTDGAEETTNEEKNEDIVGGVGEEIGGGEASNEGAEVIANEGGGDEDGGENWVGAGEVEGEINGDLEEEDGTAGGDEES